MPYVIVAALAAVVTALAVPLVRVLALRIGAVDQPGGRHVHTRATPTLGGLAMLVGVGAGLLIAAQLKAFNPVYFDSTEPLAVGIAGAVICLLGAADDIWDLSAPAKVASQVLAASILWFFGVTMFWFKVPFAGIVVLAPSMLPLLTAVWVVAMTNAINLIDGLDGLAAGIVAIASIAFGIYSVHLQSLGQLPASSLGPLVASITAGVALGFLPWNFNPARIFMGDAGAMLLGLLLAAATSVVGGRTVNVSDQTFFFFAPLAIPFVILGVPMTDMVLAIVRRARHHQSVATPDTRHLHHRLREMGHGPRRAVAILWAWTAVLSAFALVPSFVPSLDAELPIAVVAAGVLLFTVFHPDLRRRSDVS
jgi:UDP-GlcNAc:undecaprenyl-phosphate GlcNAc-1-phosphate transferase